MYRQITVVKDDDIAGADYVNLLRQEGFVVEAYSFKEEVLAAIVRRPPELVLLILTFHHKHHAGFHICAELRRRSEILPIVFLASHAAEAEKIAAFRLGADDYITKNISLEYLIVRLEAIFRRCDLLRLHSPSNTHSVMHPTLSECEVVFDDSASQAFWRGVSLDLSLPQYRMLRELYGHRGEPRSHVDLMHAANIAVEYTTVVGYINAIRNEFRRIDPSFDLIHTQRGRGYRWVSLHF